MATMSAEARRRAYLKALEIDVYTMRGHDVEPTVDDSNDDSYETDADDASHPTGIRFDETSLDVAVASCTRVAHRLFSGSAVNLRSG